MSKIIYPPMTEKGSGYRTWGWTSIVLLGLNAVTDLFALLVLSLFSSYAEDAGLPIVATTLAVTAHLALNVWGIRVIHQATKNQFSGFTNETQKRIMKQALLFVGLYLPFYVFFAMSGSIVSLVTCTIFLAFAVMYWVNFLKTQKYENLPRVPVNTFN